MTRQFAAVSEHDILKYLRIPDDELPPLTVILGPCRSGTTALLRAAAATGHRAYFQPLKRIIRQLSVGGSATQFELPPSGDRIVIKETFGPFLLVEARFDPVMLLTARGYPKELITVLVMVREPGQMYLSWQRLYRSSREFGGVDVRVYSAAVRHTLACYQAACDAGITATAFVPDGMAEAGEHVVLAAIFQRCGLRFGPEAVDWQASGQQLDSVIERDSEPEPFRVPGALDTIRRSAGYRLLPPPSAEMSDTMPTEVIALRGTYDMFRAQCAADLFDS